MSDDIRGHSTIYTVTHDTQNDCRVKCQWILEVYSVWDAIVLNYTLNLR